MHPNSLRNLKRPLPGEVRNPRGINQYTKDRERRQAFRALCAVIEETSGETREAVLVELARLFCAGAAAGDWRLLRALLDSEWPKPILPKRQRWSSGR